MNLSKAKWTQNFTPITTMDTMYQVLEASEALIPSLCHLLQSIQCPLID